MFPSPNLAAPAFWHNRTVGLLGGSFNPAHKGHMLIAKRALALLPIDCVWWMVSPENPLKKNHPERTDFASRLYKTEKYVTHPKMLVTGIEEELSTRYSYETILKLKYHFPKTKFVWIAGTDNAAVFDKWDCWQELIETIPFCFFARPPLSSLVKKTKLDMLAKNKIKHIYASDRNNISELPEQGVIWVKTGKTRNISSSAIRMRQK